MPQTDQGWMASLMAAVGVRRWLPLHQRLPSPSFRPPQQPGAKQTEKQLLEVSVLPDPGQRMHRECSKEAHRQVPDRPPLTKAGSCCLPGSSGRW